MVYNVLTVQWQEALYLLALAVIHGLVYWVAQDGYPSYVTAVLLFFFPICLYSCCQVTLRKQHFLTGCQTPPQGFWNTCYYNFHRKFIHFPVQIPSRKKNKKLTIFF